MFNEKNPPRGWLQGTVQHLGKGVRYFYGLPSLIQSNQSPTVLGERPPEIPLDKEELLPVLPVTLHSSEEGFPGSKKSLKVTTRTPEITHLRISTDIKKDGKFMRPFRVRDSDNYSQHVPFL